MRTLGTAVVAAVMLGLAAPAAVAQNAAPDGCGMAGTWKGSTGGTSFLATYADTKGTTAGTADLDLWGDVTSGGAFSSAVRMTSGRGSWTRVSAGIFDYHFLAVGLDAAGTPVYQLKVAGRKSMASDCASQTFSVTIALYAPWQDPFGADAPLFAGPFPGAPGQAVRLPYPR